jgi:hypothetical protein
VPRTVRLRSRGRGSRSHGTPFPTRHEFTASLLTFLFPSFFAMDFYCGFVCVHTDNDEAKPCGSLVLQEMVETTISFPPSSDKIKSACHASIFTEQSRAERASSLERKFTED